MMILKKIIGWPIAHGLYTIGDIASWLIEKFDSDEDWETYQNKKPNRLWQFGFDVYQWTMSRSCMINDWAGLSLWTAPD